MKEIGVCFCLPVIWQWPWVGSTRCLSLCTLVRAFSFEIGAILLVTGHLLTNLIMINLPVLHRELFFLLLFSTEFTVLNKFVLIKSDNKNKLI